MSAHKECILVLNAGSSSLKAALFSLPDLTMLWSAKREISALSDFAVVTSVLVSSLANGSPPILAPGLKIVRVGHRIVHGGEEFVAPTVIDEKAMRQLANLSSLAPLHNPLGVECVRVARKELPTALQIAVFDTAFHATMPKRAFSYGGPAEWNRVGLRRFGFHGISVHYSLKRAAELLSKTPDELSIVVCHLGNGCSLTAIENGCSVDTTMGFTPLEGPMMGTRSGTVDPGLIFHLLRQGKTVDELEQLLNCRSGLLGLSEVSSDLRVLLPRESEVQIDLALQVFVHQIRRSLGSMLASLSRLDAVIFTGGIGEHQPEIRKRVCQGAFGLEISDDANHNAQQDTIISHSSSLAKILVVATKEEQEIAKQCLEIE